MDKGTHEQLLKTSDEYRAIYELQTKNHGEEQPAGASVDAPTAIANDLTAGDTAAQQKGEAR